MNAKNAIGIVCVGLVVALAGCYPAKREDVLFEADAVPLTIKVVYSGRSEKNDGEVVLICDHRDYGTVSRQVLLRHLEYPERPDIHDFKYDDTAHEIQMTIVSRSERRKLHIPVIIPSTGSDRFLMENAAVLKRFEASESSTER